MRWRLHFFFILFSVGILAAGSSAEAQTEKYLEVRKGTLPLIFTVPHGGGLKPEGFMNRRYGSVAADAQTRDLADEIDQAVRAQLGGSATFIISHLHRSKMDPNRDEAEAAQDDAGAQKAWRAFHAACAQAGREVAAKHGSGLLLDLHGHRHEEPNVELGMLLRGDDLRLTDKELSVSAALLARTSIREMVVRTGKPLADLVRGPMSLGTLMEIRGQRCLPSTVRPQPVEGAAYYNGAYIVATHGSSHGGTINAIQVECPWDGVRDTPENRRLFAERLVGALAEYLPAHLNWKRE